MAHYYSQEGCVYISCRHCMGFLYGWVGSFTFSVFNFCSTFSFSVFFSDLTFISLFFLNCVSFLVSRLFSHLYFELTVLFIRACLVLFLSLTR